MSELSFISQVLVLFGVLTDDGPARDLATEEAERFERLEVFFTDHLFSRHRTGYPHREKLEALWFAIVEPGFVELAIIDRETAVRNVQKAIRRRSRPEYDRLFNRAPMAELDPAVVAEQPRINPWPVPPALSTEACSVLVDKLSGYSWTESATRADLDANGLARARREIKKKFGESAKTTL